MKNRILASALLLLLVASLSHCSSPKEVEVSSWDMLASVLSDTILQMADQHLSESPITVTAAQSPRSAGGIHDFYSEGDYWWPDSANPDGPYQRRDGLTNPDNFTDHRQALMRFSELVGTLTSAYLITQDSAYSKAAIRHMRAWFVEEKTKMNPNLLYAQAIQGRHTGRGIGIIDAIHLMEVVQSIRVLERAGKMESADLISMRAWFSDFVQWLTTHPYGIDEMVHPNNHGSCWNMQVAIYARFTHNDSLLDACRNNYQQTLLLTQMAADGSFPLELARTKPYGYALFNLDAMAMNCLILSDATHDLWSFSNESGAGIQEGLAYMAPYVADKQQWPLEPDVMYWEQWPVAQPAFLFGGLHFGRTDWIELWKDNRHFLEVTEVKRNVPIRNPLLWLEDLTSSPSNTK